MKAVVLRANRQLAVEDVPPPDLLPGECRIAVRAAGVCSSDVARAFEGGAYIYPLIMGHELAGEVIECGSGIVEGLHPGQRVVVFPLIPCGRCGSCAEAMYARCREYDYYGSRRHGGFVEFMNVRSGNLLPVSDDVSFDDAALVEPVAVALHALDRGGVFDDTSVGRLASVAILGAGFLGLTAVQVLQRWRHGAAVTVLDRNPDKLRLGAAAGARTVHVPDEHAWRAWLDAHRDSYTLVLEASGAPATFRYALELAEPGGTVVWMGNISADLTVPKAIVSRVLRKELRVLGTWNSSYRGRDPSDWTKVLQLFQNGLRPSALVTHVIGLDQLPELLRQLHAHKSGLERHSIVKVLVRPNVQSVVAGWSGQSSLPSFERRRRGHDNSVPGHSLLQRERESPEACGAFGRGVPAARR